MEVYQTSLQVKNKADGSPITQADQNANSVILECLAATPYPVISEESQAADFQTRKDWGTLWMVDPLDGTREFIDGSGEFTVNIALIDEGRPAMGVILAPVTGTLWTGSMTGGAYKLEGADMLFSETGLEAAAFLAHANRIKTNQDKYPDSPHEVIIGVSRSHKEQNTQALIRKIADRYKEVRIGQMGSSLKFCEMAEGKMSIYPRCTPIFEWDTAAGHAILHAAGGEVYNLDNYKPLEYNKPDLRSKPFIAFSTRPESDRFFAEFPLQVGI